VPGHTRARVAGTVVALLVAVAALGLPAPAKASAADDFVAKINQLRGSRGLAPLAVHPELSSLGQRWAGKMAADGYISHNPNLAGSVSADWQKLGENVGVGYDVDGLFRAFVASPEHYRNLVEPAFTHVGVGVVIAGDGRMFTAHEFMALRGARAAPPPPAPRAAPTATRSAAPRAPAPARPSGPTTTVPAPPPPPPPPPAHLTSVLEQLRALDQRA
jgi:hypothetical protein